MINIEDVTKNYTEGNSVHRILDNVNLKINKGEIVVLLGKSGSGKTTLLNLISGIDLPDSGSISVNGKNLTGFSEKERTLFRRKNVGFIFQFFNLIPTLTVEENISLPLELNEIKFTGNDIFKILSEVGLEGRNNTYPDKLSGGEQQRVAIARALVHNPEIIIADEPTGNLDLETGKKIIGLIDGFIKKKSKTMIMATHAPDVIGIADRIIGLKDGNLYELRKSEYAQNPL
jgi:putative ABC transport system ATP-binding protein